ncbi:MAG: hypothetical protein ABI855_06100, partial [Bacteroidota bacterium]
CVPQLIGNKIRYKKDDGTNTYYKMARQYGGSVKYVFDVVKDKDITALNDQIASLNTSVSTLKTNVDDLTAKNDVSTKMIEDQTTKLNTAYVAVGSSKQLSEKKVVARHGGVLGIGKSTLLEPNVNQEAFNTIDITKTNSIPLNVKDAKLVSAHPSDSYKIERTTDKKVTELVITDPAKFWSESKYLVVMTQQ